MTLTKSLTHKTQCWGIIFSLFFSYAYAQKIDTLYVPSSSILTVGDTAIFIERDTIIYLPSSEKNRFRRIYQSDAFYDSLKKKASHHKFTEKVYRWLVREYKIPPSDSLYEGKIMKAQLPFLPYEGKIIRKIRFKKVDVFAGSVYDTLKTTRRRLEKWGNNLHYHTQDDVLRRNLLLREGQRVVPMQVADAERVLRSLPQVRDARIVLLPIADDNEGVEMLVITQDIWAIGVELDIANLRRFSMEVFNKNIFGSANELAFRNIYRLPDWGYQATYRVQNFRGSFISALATVENNYLSKGWSLQANRDFIAPQIKYAGGATLQHKTNYETLQLSKDSLYAYSFRFFSQDYWLARAWQVKKENRKNVVVGFRYMQTSFQERPLVKKDSNFRFHQQKTLLGSITYSLRYYRKTNLIFGFGRTEDVPLGMLLTLLVGVKDTEFVARPYTSVLFRWAGYNEKWGFLNVGWSIGNYWYRNYPQDGIQKLQLTYFTPLLSVGKKYKLRQFASTAWMGTYSVFMQDSLSISDKEGIRGLKTSLHGDKKWVCNLESILFTPWYLYGFRAALYGFLDVAFLHGFSGKSWFAGTGIGIRLRNERLAIKEISARWSFYPLKPTDANWYDLHVYTTASLRLQDMQARKPSLISLQRDF